MTPVKVIPTLLALAVSAVGSPSDPGQTAVSFLEKVRAGNLNLAPGGDTALSPQTSEKKRERIAKRLQRIARDLGSDPLEVGAVKLDGELAAVLVRKIGGFDPSSTQVFPIALIKRDAQWTAAPVPASFENSGVRFATRLRERLEALENWMLREQVLDLEKIRQSSADRMRRRIEEAISATELRSLDARQTAERFLKACASHNLPEIFGLLGGLSTQLPNDWSLRLKAAESAILSASELELPWRLLLSREVLRAPVNLDEDDGNAMFSIACLDPAGAKSHTSLPKIQLVYLGLSKTPDGFWRIDPPAAFLNPDGNYEDQTDDALDADLLDAFPGELAKRHPPAPAESLESMRESLIGALESDSPAAPIPLIQPNFDGRSAGKSIIQAARLWWMLRNPANLRRIIPLAHHREGDKAAASFQLFSVRNPDRLDLRVLYFEKSPGGWFWTPAPSPETHKRFREWTDKQNEQWQPHWQDTLLADSPVLEIADDAVAPSEDEIRKLIDSWLEALESGNIPAALRLTARLESPQSSTTLLRNLGYEMAATRGDGHEAHISAIHRANPWATVSVETGNAGNSSMPVYPILATPSGPRILLEIDLFRSTSRSRDFLNKESLKRLKNISPDAAESLKSLFSIHPPNDSAQSAPK